MKRILLLSVILLCAVAIQAVPAYPGTIQVRQPDGSFITLRLLGDEWLNFNTTVDGYSVVKDKRGYYVYAEKKDGRLQATSRVAHDVAERSVDEQTYLAGVKKYQMPQMSSAIAALKSRVEAEGAKRRAQRRASQYDFSKFKGLIVLVQFNDKEFSRPDYKDILKDMVNQEGYTGYETQKMTGSVRDYFSDNSDGKFQPQFDVVGPYTVDFSQYDCNIENGRCDEVLLAAINSVDVDVNFKDYDGDNDRAVDLIFFVFAGIGANYSGNNEDLWWPHRSQIWNKKEYDNGGNPYVFKDDVLLWDYASSTELAGYTSQPSSIKIDGIGTICHEFSHVLGLPDFYDSNYEEDGLSVTPSEWSVMAKGCYLNDGFTPAGYSLYERYSVGFTDEPQKIVGEGSYMLQPLHVSHTGFRIDSPEKDEFFLLENRQNGDFKWDAYLPGHGMLVHRVDLSNKNVWWNNVVNANPERNYYELVRAGGNGRADTNYDVFPGKGKVTELHNGTSPANLKTWSGKGTKWGLFNIREDKGVVSFDIQDVMNVTAISLPDSLEVGVDFSKQVKVTLVPDYVDCVLEWSSSNTNIASVDNSGIVTGISEGECVITAVSPKNISASCVVTVKKMMGSSIAEFKAMNEQEEVFLALKDVEVLYVYQSRAYIRDSTGAITLNNVGISLNRNDRLNGLVYGKLTYLNNMAQFSPVANYTNTDDITVTAGNEVRPHEKTLDELSPEDYSDYVLVKGVKLVKDIFCYAVSDDRRVRVYSRFGTQGGSLPTNYDGKYYDVEAIFGTNRLNGKVIDELCIVKTPTEVEAPDGIVELRLDVQDNRMPAYNLQGQRVSPTTKGLLIRGGRKLLNR